MPPKLPIEYAEVLDEVEKAWKEYDRLLEADAPRAKIEAAFQRACQAEAEKRRWYELWQEVGGTSDIESIVDALREKENDYGSRFIISGGEVLEIR
jgi:hypothetical protein